jgi:hypothetical protein
MSQQAVKLIDQGGNVVASARVADEGGYYGGTIDLGGMPDVMRRVFDEFEEIVNGQMLSFLDEIEGKIAALSLRVLLQDGSSARVRDLQIYPATGDVSFKLAEAPARRTATA